MAGASPLRAGSTENGGRKRDRRERDSLFLSQNRVFFFCSSTAFLGSLAPRPERERKEATSIVSLFLPPLSPPADSKRRTCSSPPYPLRERLVRLYGVDADAARRACQRARGEAQKHEVEHPRDDDELVVVVAPPSSCRLLVQQAAARQQRLLDRRPKGGAPERRGVSPGRA